MRGEALLGKALYVKRERIRKNEKGKEESMNEYDFT